MLKIFWITENCQMEIMMQRWEIRRIRWWLWYQNTLPVHLGAFILGNSKRKKNTFLWEIDGFKILTFSIQIWTVYT